MTTGGSYEPPVLPYIAKYPANIRAAHFIRFSQRYTINFKKITDTLLHLIITDKHRIHPLIIIQHILRKFFGRNGAVVPLFCVRIGFSGNNNRIGQTSMNHHMEENIIQRVPFPRFPFLKPASCRSGDTATIIFPIPLYVSTANW